jgi:hypothetical protein
MPGINVLLVNVSAAEDVTTGDHLVLINIKCNTNMIRDLLEDEFQRYHPLI